MLHATASVPLLMFSHRYNLSFRSSGKVRSDAQKSTLLENRAALLHQIENWRKVQAVYMPGALETSGIDPESLLGVKAESVKLWLPSQLNTEDRDAVCSIGVINCEKELRFAQLEDSLDDLRRARRTRHGLITFHRVQLAGQGQKTQTKSQAAMQSIQDRIDRHVRRYRAARIALLCLDPHGDWAELYPPLTDNDNRGPMKEQTEISSSDGQYAPSWIWHSNTTSVSPEEVNEDMRVEWAQCMARVDRWEEEVILLQEEMRRVVHFLEWRSSDWLTKVDSRTGTIAPSVRSGLSAYANKQATVFHNLAVRFCQRWHSTLTSLSLPHCWATEFLEVHIEPLSNMDFKKRKRVQGSPVAHSCKKSLPSAAAPSHISLLSGIPETDVDSDETPSDDESSSSFSE